MLHAEKFNIDASLRELMPHGSASFPMEVEWADFRRMVGGMISWHWHEDLQFFLISEGEVEITVGRVRHHLKEGEGLFVNSGLLHMSRSLSEGWRSAYYCLDFSPMLLSCGILAGVVIGSSPIVTCIFSRCFTGSQVRVFLFW